MASLTDESNDVPSATTAASPTITLDQLPNDVLLSIWSHLDDPVPFSLVNKRFQTLSKDTLWRAKWLMQRYERYLVIFEAIARPKLFTPSLLDRLIRLGAPLSVNLVQLIQLMWNASVREMMFEMDRRVRWGRITLAAYAALMQHAADLYSDNISFEREDCQSSIFEEWTSSQRWILEEEGAPSPSDQVRLLFKIEGFMPLPLTASYDPDYGLRIYKSEHMAFEAISYDPALAASAIQNGFILTAERTQRIVDNWVELFGSSKMNGFIDALKVDGVVNISKHFVTQTFEMRHDCHLEYCLGTRQQKSICSVLVRLNEASALPFRLQDLVKDYASHVAASQPEPDQSSN